MGIRKKMVSEIQKMMFSPESIRNIGIVAHIDHGKTTLSDNLLAAAGLISPELAGSQLYLDSDEQEQARGITINAANVSMIHDFKEKEYLINMIDTPGHVDFGGDVTRAMRAVDGVVVVACAVEGCMPQTETVVRQALKERVKPVLFINKVDRLINEIKLTPEEMQNRFMAIINEFNKLLKKSAPPEFQKTWAPNVADGTVAFGSAYHNWAINVPYMKEYGISFKDIIEYNRDGNQKELAKKAPISEILLDMVVKHLPNPRTAQKYRIPQIWSGDIESPEGKAMMECDQKAKLAMMITDISIDPNAGEVATGRVFSGSIKKGSEVYLYNMKTKARIQQVGVYMGAERVIAEEVPAGNIAAITGLKEAIAGETLSDATVELAPFEEMKHTSEPVVTKAIEAKNMKDLPKLVEAL
ncbi:MAG TPA: GTP-binding protein, partial [Euryarchaeota archaeon]|nr:GTP-binding protein [Euryarchaeota archaeon]